MAHHGVLLVSGCGDDVGVEHISIVTRGGARTAAHVGAVADAVRASVSTAHANECCAAQNVPRSEFFH